MRIFQPQFGSGTSDVRRGVNRAKNVILQGNEPSIGEIFDLKIQYGRFFNETDADHKAPVVLLGYDTTRILFPESPEHSIGQEVTIDGQLFTVIGTIQKQKQGISGGSNPENSSLTCQSLRSESSIPITRTSVIFAESPLPG
jgi:putative ABC transport system permease protein